MIRVQFRLFRESDTIFWVMLSRALVASSNRSTFGPGAIARAIISRCFWPPEIPPLPSLMRVCICMGICRMSSAAPAISAARQASSTESQGADTVMFA